MPHSSLSLSTNTAPAIEAYVWGYPLMAVHRTRLLFCSRTATGLMNHVNDLATPADRGVVVPNNDTLYSSGWYDLRHGDLNIEVPAMDHASRYWNLMIVDAYTHVAYVCRRHHGVAGTRVRVTYDPSAAATNDNSTVIPIATPTAWVIIRVLVETPHDLPTARTLQQAFKITPPTAHPNDTTVRAGRPTTIADAGADFYSELARYVELDPPAPWHPPLSAAAHALINSPSQFSTEELAAGVQAGEKLVRGMNVNGSVQKNGWSTGRDAQGFGNDILKRAVGAKFGLGGHQAIENRSYTAQEDIEGNKPDGNRVLTMRFGANALPPCNAFWSLTAYGTDLYLVANEIDRWSIGDRTPELVYADDGSLTIHISANHPPDTANWLPVPSGPYLLGMRVYEGRDEVVGCEWFPPALEIQSH